MHNGNGTQTVVTDRSVVLGGFWLVNDAYDDGFRDALVQTGQTSECPALPRRTALPLGVGDSRRHRLRRLAEGRVRSLRWSGWSLRERRSLASEACSATATGNGPVQTPGAPRPVKGVARSSAGRARSSRIGTGRRTRQTGRAQYPAPPAASSAAGRGSGCPVWRPAGWLRPTPPPTPPAPEYWASMAGAAEAAGTPSAAVTPPAAPDARQDEHPDAPRGAAGTAV